MIYEKKITAAFIFAAFYIFCGCICCFAETVHKWNFSANEFSYNDMTGIYSGKGDVLISGKDTELHADYISFHQKNMTAFASGNIILKSGKDYLKGESILISLEDEIGTLHNGEVFLEENHFFIRGEQIEKTGKNTYYIDKASLTSCDGVSPDWRITGRDLDVAVEGYGTIKHVTLWAKNVPVIYTPFLFFPAKIKRQSGLLSPWISYSERRGEEFVQPLYWAINKSSDAAFYIHHTGQRGQKFGLEYRYTPSGRVKGAVMADFLEDRRVDDGTSETEKWGYDGLGPRRNKDRFWFRMKHDHSFSSGLDARLDVDIVSDHDYLREFKDGPSGFDDTDKYFEKVFGRGFDEYDDTERVNSLILTKNWEKFSFNTQVKWYDDVINKREDEPSSSVHKLPIIEFKGAKQKLFSSPLYFDLSSEYSYSYIEKQQRDHKFEVYPRFYLPFKIKNIISVEPSVGLRETAWSLKDPNRAAEDENLISRELLDTKLDVSSEVFKVYDIDGEKIDKIKHSLKFGLEHYFIPDVNQTEIRESEIIAEKNSAVFSITNTFTSRFLKTDSYGYREFCKIKISQPYNFEKQEKRFEPLKGEIEFSPVDNFSLKADISRSFYEDFNECYSIAAEIKDARGDRLFAEHRYEHDLKKSFYADLSLVINNRLKIYANYERDMFAEVDIKSGFGFSYNADCWGFKAGYYDDKDDRAYTFGVELYGLTKFERDV